jgi:hypothetical protein
VHEQDQPAVIGEAEKTSRIARIAEIASRLHFVGHVEYRHVYSQSSGAQYGIGPRADDDILVVYAEAFERDSDPDDFRLEAFIAHESGHQRLHRDSTLRPVLAKFPGDELEEIVASLIGSILLGEPATSQTLVWKATAELTDLGMAGEKAKAFAERLHKLLRQLL